MTWLQLTVDPPAAQHFRQKKKFRRQFIFWEQKKKLLQNGPHLLAGNRATLCLNE